MHSGHVVATPSISNVLGQLGVGGSGVDVRDPPHLQPVALQSGAYLAQVGDVVRLALDDVAERTLPGQAVLGEGAGQSVPVVIGQALQVTLDRLTFRRVAHHASAPALLALRRA